MTLKRLRLRNLVYHWRGNSAVLLGVVVGTAVLTGALLVGDSLRGSLRDHSLERLGWVDQALVAPRFFRQELADELWSMGSEQRMCPVLILQATAVARRKPSRGTAGGPILSQARGVTVIGVDYRFWSNSEDDPTIQAFHGLRGHVWLNSTLARDLGYDATPRPSLEVSLRLQQPTALPRETLLGKKDVAVDEWSLPVGEILRDGDMGNSFSLRPGLEPPRTAFVALDALQARLKLEGRVNAILAGGVLGPLQQELESHLRLEDWGLVLHTPESRVQTLFTKLDRNKDGQLQPREWRGRLAGAVVRAINPGRNPTLTRAEVEAYYRRQRGYLALESRQLLLEPVVGRAAVEAAKEIDLRAAPTLVYLADTLAAGKGQVPYAVVAALDPTQAPPLGPFLPKGVSRLKEDEIVLARWEGSPLKDAHPGDQVMLTYLPAEEQHGTEQQKRVASFRLAGMIDLKGVAADPDLTPEFPGITDKTRIDQWENPFPSYDPKRIKQADEAYWEEYRTTPRAYVNLEVGQRLWRSRFGTLTSVRLAPEGDRDLNECARAYRQALLRHLSPRDGGFVFDDVRKNALEASTGSTDFVGLFVGFSFFLIVAALLLVGLLFRLNLDRRAAEVGLLFAEGFRRSAVQRLLLGEGSVLAAAGAVIGCCAAIAYAGLLVQLLAALWPGGELRSFLRPHVTGLSLVYGCAGSLLISVLTIAGVVFFLGRVPPRALLAGQTTAEGELGLPARPRWSPWVAGISLVGALVLLGCAPFVSDPEAQASTFFGSGALLLTACLAGLWWWMRSSRQGAVAGHGWWGVARLGTRNAARHPTRSLLTAGLLASATFLIVAVDVFRRQAEAASEDIRSPSGGFALLAESDLPLFRDLNSEAGRQEVLNRLELQLQDEGKDSQTIQQERLKAETLLRHSTFFAFRLKAGDDASCLNLYRPTHPRLLGVPAALIERGGFVFAASAAQNDAEKANPWLLLRRTDSPLPAFGENNTVTWILGGKLGGTLTVPVDRVVGEGTSPGPGEQPLRIDGLLQDSVFQSSLLVSEENFLRLYPGHEGYNFFLIDPPHGQEEKLRGLLERTLADRGFEVTPTAQRLEAYLAVENTYLSTFQALGGLGLILGSLGLAVVLLRGVWERRGELALMRALGFRRGALAWLVLAENGWLLLLGLGAGTVSALVAVAPHLTGGGFDVWRGKPWLHLLGLLAAVLVVGLLAGAVAVATTLRAPLIPALRRE